MSRLRLLAMHDAHDGDQTLQRSPKASTTMKSADQKASLIQYLAVVCPDMLLGSLAGKVRFLLAELEYY